ncbi:serine--tRNA ligase [Candidatus Palauibacter sp.]|uniref:serine--tRNA ligase n=1 Tax=Candidatus Palauibacter sp. TaxID=3101350 RepID=UPI003AF27833
MLDLKVLRDDSARVLAAMRRRGDERAMRLVEETLGADELRRRLIRRVEALKAERNAASKAIGEAKKSGEDASAQIEAMRTVAGRIKALDADLAGAETAIRDKLLQIPNLPDPRVPPGEEGEGPTVAAWGAPRKDAVPPHWVLGATHGYRDPGSARLPGGRTPSLDTERGAKIAGTGFPLLVGGGARLSRALVQFMLDLHVREHGYLEILPPLLVSRDSMTGTGHIPKFEDDAYRTDPDDLFLVPTAEVPLTNLHRGEILADEDLPLAYTAHTPCFRREAGAAGRDTRGLLRVHQFDKVEIVRICRPEESEEQLELLTRHAERVLELLEVPYRRVLLPLADLGFANSITYDLEIWAPGVGAWLEVSSCSSYGAFQARRADIRFRPRPGARPVYPHTLNGSALAVARLLVVLLETGFREGKGILLPEILHPYLGFQRLELCR